MDLDDTIKGLLGELKKLSSSDSVVGKPLSMGGANLLPLCRVSIGFGAGGSDMQGQRGPRDGSVEAGGAAGGLSIEPRAFVVVGPDGVPQLLSLGRGGAAQLQRPVEVPQVGPADGGGGAPALEPKGR